MKIRYLFLLLAFCSNSSWADSSNVYESPCSHTTETQQWVVAEEQDIYLGAWKPEVDRLHTLSLVNGANLGVQINPVDDAYYLERMSSALAFPESVEITIYVLGEAEPRIIAHSHGGTNSVQGYGLKTGDKSIDQIDTHGITLHLQKTKCITRSDLEK